MPDKQCTQCGEVLALEANFCFACGGSDFRDLPPGLAQRLDTAAQGPTRAETPASVAVRLTEARVIAFTVLSAGLYLFYWFYLTWKQLANETGEDHYPVWHALSLLVPIYNLFRLHKHMTVIEELAAGANVVTTLSPGHAVLLLIIATVLSSIGARIFDPVIAVPLLSISVALITIVLFSAQSSLNRCWINKRGPILQDARIGVGEVILILVGLVGWIGTFLPE